MSESNEHRDLVLKMTEILQQRYPRFRLVSDIRLSLGGQDIPPIIDSRRPDIFAQRQEAVLIGEAKTFQDLETKRSEAQINAFIQHVEKHGGCFILGVYGDGAANRAKTILRFASKRFPLKQCQLEVFDGMDCWKFTPNGRRIWDLI